MVVETATADVLDSLPVVPLCIVLQQLAQCRFVARIDIEHLPHRRAKFLSRLLAIGLVGSLHDEHLGVLLWASQQRVESSFETCRISRVAMHVGNIRLQQHDTQLCRRIGMKQQRVAHIIVAVVLPDIMQVIHRSELKVCVCGFLTSYLIIDFECLHGIARLHIQVAHHNAQIHVVWRLVAKRLQLHESRVELTFLLIEPELLDAYLWAWTFEKLNTVEGSYRFVCHSCRFVELYQLQNDVATSRLQGRHLL